VLGLVHGRLGRRHQGHRIRLRVGGYHRRCEMN
jgi:hypothetical protein